MPADVRPDARVHPGVLLRADGAEAPRARQLLQLGGRDGLQPVLYGLRRPGGVRGQPERPRGLAPAGAVRRGRADGQLGAATALHDFSVIRDVRRTPHHEVRVAPDLLHRHAVILRRDGRDDILA